MSMNGFRSSLIESRKHIGPTMGRVYMTAVLSCLQGDFPVEGMELDQEIEPNWPEMNTEQLVGMEVLHEQRNADLTESFYWKVVQPLRKLHA